MALALLTKGLIAPVFFFGAAIPYLLLTGQWRRWKALKPVTGLLLFLAIAAPWHILCGIINHDQGHPVGNHPTIGNVHGFFYFNTSSTSTCCASSTCAIRTTTTRCRRCGTGSAHLVWIFPWSLFLPAVWCDGMEDAAHLAASTCATMPARRWISIWTTPCAKTWRTLCAAPQVPRAHHLAAELVLGVDAALLLDLDEPGVLHVPGVAAAVDSDCRRDGGIEENGGANGGRPTLSTAWLTGAQAAFAVIGVAVGRGAGLGTVDVAQSAVRGRHRHAAGASRRGRLHALDVAPVRFDRAFVCRAAASGGAGGDGAADRAGAGWLLRLKSKHMAATISVALTMTVFFIAAHIAFARFEPMLSSKQLADTIMAKGSPNDTFIIYGEQSSGSSVIFYTDQFFPRPAGAAGAAALRPERRGHDAAVGILLSRCARHLPERR